PRAPLSPSVFLVRSQDAVACLVIDFYPKELHVSLASLRASVLAQSLIVTPTAHGTYNAIQIGRIGENESITCSVQHLGKETLVSFQPGMVSQNVGNLKPEHPVAQDKRLKKPSHQRKSGPKQRNQVLLGLLGLRLLLMKTLAINILFTTMFLIF
uniref:Immunoglobulin C1-set domain-containing protein n=1 Tax=Sarcophilus harrisii TaxID=9305 RepID=G3WP23_SARHA